MRRLAAVAQSTDSEARTGTWCSNFWTASAGGSIAHRGRAGVLRAVDRDPRRRRRRPKTCVHNGDDWRKGTVSIGAIHTVAPYLLPEIVQRFTKRFPHAQVTVEEQFTEDLIDVAWRGDLDVGIVALPIAEKRLRVEPLFKEQLVAACRQRARSPSASAGARRRHPRAVSAARRNALLRPCRRCNLCRSRLRAGDQLPHGPIAHRAGNGGAGAGRVAGAGDGPRRNRDRRCVYRSLTGPPRRAGNRHDLAAPLPAAKAGGSGARDAPRDSAANMQTNNDTARTLPLTPSSADSVTRLRATRSEPPPFDGHAARKVAADSNAIRPHVARLVSCSRTIPA